MYVRVYICIVYNVSHGKTIWSMLLEDIQVLSIDSIPKVSVLHEHISIKGISTAKTHISSFLGISIISDIFMCAIEKITSKTTEIHIASADADSPSDVIEVPCGS